MRKIASFFLGIVVFMAAAAAENCKESEKILRDDCHASFFVPNGLEYVEIIGALGDCRSLRRSWSSGRARWALMNQPVH